jgi:hypothetical protein
LQLYNPKTHGPGDQCGNFARKGYESMQRSTGNKQKRKSKAYRQRSFLDALRVSSWNVSEACRQSGIHRSTFYLWMDDSDFVEKVHEIKEERIDFAESKLMEKIGDGNIIAILFFLKCQGKNRGWVEDQRVQVESRLKSLSKEEIDSIVAAGMNNEFEALIPRATKDQDLIDVTPEPE